MNITEVFTGIYVVVAKFKFSNGEKGSKNIATILAKRTLFLKIEQAANMIAKLNLILDAISTPYFSAKFEVYKSDFVLGNIKAKEIHVYGEKANDYIESLKDEREDEIRELMEADEEDFSLNEYLKEAYWNDKVFNDILLFEDILDRITPKQNNPILKIGYDRSLLSKIINKNDQMTEKLMTEVFDYYYLEILSRDAFSLARREERNRNKQFPALPWARNKNL